ncbi:MAG: hypothetical protein NZ919_03605 [Candidatus Caldarchaeum sp.]|nr:hypothetical protein [Candidatus Caldarchaeum sp.]
MSSKPDASASLILVDLLKTLKTMMDYKTLSSQTGIPVSTLSRYVTNKTIPRGRRLPEMVDKLLQLVDLEAFVRQHLVSDGEDVDISSVVSESQLVKLIVPYMYKEFVGYKIDAVLAVDKAGLIIATAFGLATMKKTYYCTGDETGFPNRWRELKYRVKEARMWSKLYVPREVLKSNILLTVGVLDNILLFKELRNRVAESKGDITGVFSLVSSRSFMKAIKPYQLGKVVSLVIL